MSTDVALPSQQRARDGQSLAAFIRTLLPEIQRALPKGLDADRIARLALTVVRQSEMEAQKAGKPQNSLVQCSPESFAGALLTSAALGLEPGVNGESYLVPYKRECQLIIGYQGYAKLFWQNPLARHLDAQPVFELDSFDFAYGLNPVLVHRPARGDRGAVIYYYAVGTLANGGSSFVVLTPEEVKRLRGGKVGSSGNIADPMRWMERKTAVRQLIKTLPRSTALNAAMVADEEVGSNLRPQQIQATVSGVDTATGEIEAGSEYDPATSYDPTEADDWKTS